MYLWEIQYAPHGTARAAGAASEIHGSDRASEGSIATIGSPLWARAIHHFSISGLCGTSRAFRQLLLIERRNLGAQIAKLRLTVTSARCRKKNWCEPVVSNLSCILSVEGEAVNPARAPGIVERLLAAALAHMRCVP
jgi:hypothetical protein